MKYLLTVLLTLFCLSTTAIANNHSVKSWPGFSFYSSQYFHDKFYFIGSSPEHFYALWVIDDYDKPPKLIAELYPDASSDHNFSFFSDDSENLFVVMKGAGDVKKSELWSIDVNTNSVNKLLTIENLSDSYAKVDLIGELVFIYDKAIFITSSINETGDVLQVIYETNGTVDGTKPSNLFKYSQLSNILNHIEVPLKLMGFYRGRFYFTRAYYDTSSFDEDGNLTVSPNLFYFSQNKLRSYTYNSSWFADSGFFNKYEPNIVNELSYVDGQLFDIIQPAPYTEFEVPQALESFTILADFYQVEDYSVTGSIVYKHNNKLFYFDKGFSTGGRATDIDSSVHVLDLISGINTNLGQWYSTVIPLYMDNSLGWNDFEIHNVGSYFNGNYYFNLGEGEFHGYGSIGDTAATELINTDDSSLTRFSISMPNATNISVSNDILQFNSEGNLWLSDGTPQGTSAFFLESSQLIEVYNNTSFIQQAVNGKTVLWLSDLTIDNTNKVYEFSTIIDDISEYVRVGSKIIYKVKQNLEYSMILLDWTTSEVTSIEGDTVALLENAGVWQTNKCFSVSNNRFNTDLSIISFNATDNPVTFSDLPVENITVKQFDSYSFTINLSSNMEWQENNQSTLGDVLLTQEGTALKITYRSYETIGKDVISLKLKEPSCASNNINIPINIIKKDSDNDGMDDGFEYVYGFKALIKDADEDLDQDNLSNLEEYFLGTRPDIADTDKDGTEDDRDTFPLDDTESIDTDGDGIGNNIDTDDDNDGVNDADDAFPLDASQSSEVVAPSLPEKSSGGSTEFYLLILCLMIKLSHARRVF